ncbi:chymotrypsin-2-like [Epargyreus clarus]|uniref:chymotrypsin-2-like n=1 Tax=Epargyreus clarus TaxID=520877 RepID=UPI003C2ADEFC
MEPQHDMSQFLNTRIVGGVEAPREYGRHSAALVFGEIMPHLMCGASIITEDHILTAAHCIDPLVIWGQLMPSARAVIGSNKWASTKKNIHFSGYVNHPNWNWSTLKNDIGILILAERIRLSSDDSIDSHIIPLNYDWVDGGAECFVTGWGRLGVSSNIPDKLQLLYLNTISPKQCFEGIRKASDGWFNVPPHDPKVEICTFHSVGHGMCNGDSGSALVRKDILQQIGIVSWGFPCAIGAPDVFVRIGGFKEWITSIIGK